MPSGDAGADPSEGDGEPPLAGFRSNASRLIEQGMTRGEIRKDLDPGVEAGLFVGMLRGVALQWMADPGCFDLEAVRTSLKDALRRHLAA